MRGIVEVAAELLASDDRETVLGDLAEAGETGWRGLGEVLGLVALKQLALWKDWRPWLAGFGLALPCSLSLMGISVAFSSACLQYAGGSIARSPSTMPEWLPLACQAALLLVGAWTGGFVAGSISARSIRHSVVLGCAPCLFCLARFRIESLSPLCLLLFVPAALLGLRHSMRAESVSWSSALVLSAVVTIPILALRDHLYVFEIALLWPAWYLVATCRGTRRQGERAGI